MSPPAAAEKVDDMGDVVRLLPPFREYPTNGRAGARTGADEAQRIARRFERLRCSSLSEALSVEDDEHGASLAAVLTLTPAISAAPLYEFIFSDYPVATGVHYALRRNTAGNLRQPTFCRGLIYLQVETATLGAARLRLDADRWTYQGDGCGSAEAQVIRGAVAAGGAFSPAGLNFPGITEHNLLADAIRRIGADYGLTFAGGQLMVPAAVVSVILQRVGMSATARSYDRLLATVISHPPTLSEVDALIAFTAGRRAQRRLWASTAPPLFEGTRVAALGDLSRYRLTAHQHGAAQQLITDEQLSHGEVAAKMALTVGVYEQRLRQFWKKVGDFHGRPRTRLHSHRPKRARKQSCPEALSSRNASRAETAASAESKRLRRLDLTQYRLTPNSRAALEFRRDHPELTLAQSAAELGVTKDTFAGLLRRSWKTIEKQGGGWRGSKVDRAHRRQHATSPPDGR